jgi:hypothetical protein
VFTTLQADMIAPILQTPRVTSVTSSGATLTVNANEAGTVYFKVQPSSEAAPNLTTVKSEATNTGGTAYTRGDQDLEISLPSAATEYIVYVMIEDSATPVPNPSEDPVAQTSVFTTLQAFRFSRIPETGTHMKTCRFHIRFVAKSRAHSIWCPGPLRIQFKHHQNITNASPTHHQHNASTSPAQRQHIASDSPNCRHDKSEHHPKITNKSRTCHQYLAITSPEHLHQITNTSPKHRQSIDRTHFVSLMDVSVIILRSAPHPHDFDIYVSGY